MRAIEVFKFSWRLVRVKLVRSLFIFAALFLATLVVTLFLALCAGLRHYILEPAAANLEADLIIATPKSSHSDRALSLFDYFRGTARAGIAPEVVAQVKAWPEVSKVGVETRVPFPVATRAEIVFGVPLEFDTTVSGFSETVARPFLPSGQSFSGAEEVVPVLLSPLLIEIYNSTLAEIIPGIAKKTKDDFLEKPIEFTFGRINYLTALASFPPGTVPELKRARVVGFAPFLSPFTFGIPEQVAQEVIRTYRPTVANELTPSALLIAPTSPQAVPTLEAKLTALQLSAKNLSESLGALRTTFSALQLLLLSSGGLALFLALNFFVTVLFFSSAEQRQNMALLQILGAPRRTIQAIFLLFAGMLSIPAALLGTLSAFAIAQWGNHAFSLTYGFPFFFPAAGIFVVSPILFAEIILPLIVLLFLIGSIPAIRAARNAPLLDLQKGF